MRKVVYNMSVSLDGFTQTPDGKIDWIIVDEELHTFWNAQARAADAFIFGRRMYETMAVWPEMGRDPQSEPVLIEYARIWEEKPKIVFSKTLNDVAWNSRLVRHDNLGEEVNKLKALPGTEMSVSGATLAASFIKLGLVDEFQLFIQPVILGAGTPFFPDLESRRNLKLLETRAFKSGVVYVRYEVAA